MIDARIVFRGLPFVVALALAGCDGGDEDEAEDDGDDAPTNDCSTETRDDTYMLGLTKVGEQVQVKFVDAVPAPPMIEDNIWTVEVLDMNDAPMEGMAIDVTPFMPLHQHGTTVIAHVEPGAVPGQYVIDPVNMHMAGLWEITLDITLPDTTTDSVMFTFCIDP